MMIPSFFLWLFGAVILIAWGLLLFSLGQRKELRVWFFVLLYSPLVIGFVANVVVAGGFIIALTSVWSLLFLVIFLSERVVWGVSLKDASREDKFVWFMLMLFIPLFWIFYWMVKIA